ncbi:MAG: nucleotidyltransferase family protein [Proteobacteria bacterium]|nr:nucleotidyltransferase family protein [Pseudomonadota bacterium]
MDTQLTDDKGFTVSAIKTSNSSLISICLLPKEEAILAWEEWKRNATKDNSKIESKIIPFVYLRLSNFGLKDEWLDRFAKVQQMTWAHNQLLLNEVQPVLERLNKLNIPLILLKGAAMSLHYASNLGYRYFKDIDLLIPKERMLESEQEILNTGWTTDLKKIAWIKNKSNLEEWHKTSHSAHFINANKQILDLHWFTTYCWCKDSFQKQFWDRAVKINYQGIPLNVLSPTDAFFNICLHGITQNQKEEKYWLIDIFNIIEKHKINWDLLSKLARESETKLPMSKAIEELENFNIIEAPNWIKEDLETRSYSLIENSDHFIEKNGANTIIGGLPCYISDYLRSEISSTGKSHLFQFYKFIKLKWHINSPLSLIKVIIKKIAKKWVMQLLRFCRSSKNPH